MTTTELIKLLKDFEFGGATGLPREITFWHRAKNGRTKCFTSLEVLSTGDGICGAEIDFNLVLKEE